MSINHELFTVDTKVPEHPQTPTLPGLEETVGEQKSYRDRQINIITNIKSLQNSPEKRKNSRYSVYTKFSPMKQMMGTEDNKDREPMSCLFPQCFDKEDYETRTNRSSSSYASGMSKKYFNEISILKTKIKKIIKNQECLNDSIFKPENETAEFKKSNRPKLKTPKTPVEDAYNFSFCNSFNIKNSHFYNKKKFPREIFCKMNKDRPSLLGRFINNW